MDKNDPLKAIFPIADELRPDTLMPRPRTLRIVRRVSLTILAVVVAEVVVLWFVRNNRPEDAIPLKDILLLIVFLFPFLWLLHLSCPIVCRTCGRLLGERTEPPWGFWRGQVLKFGWGWTRMLLFHLVIMPLILAALVTAEIIKCL